MSDKLSKIFGKELVKAAESKQTDKYRDKVLATVQAFIEERDRFLHSMEGHKRAAAFVQEKIEAIERNAFTIDHFGNVRLNDERLRKQNWYDAEE